MNKFKSRRDALVALLTGLLLFVATQANVALEAIPNGSFLKVTLGALFLLSTLLLHKLADILIDWLPGLRRRMFGRYFVEGYWLEKVTKIPYRSEDPKSTLPAELGLEQQEVTYAVVHIFWHDGGLRVEGCDYLLDTFDPELCFVNSIATFEDGRMKMLTNMRSSTRQRHPSYSEKNFRGNHIQSESYSGYFFQQGEVAIFQVHGLALSPARSDEQELINAHTRGHIENASGRLDSEWNQLLQRGKKSLPANEPNP